MGSYYTHEPNAGMKEGVMNKSAADVICLVNQKRSMQECKGEGTIDDIKRDKQATMSNRKPIRQ